MSASPISGKSTGRRVTMLVLGAIIACMGMFALAGSAKAAPFSMDLTNGKLNLGFAFKGAGILPAPDRIPADAPAPNLPDLWEAKEQTVPAVGACLAGIPAPCGPNPDKATVSGDITGSDLTITSTDGVPGVPSGFQFPIMVVPNPLDNSPVPISLAATGDVTGTVGTDGDGKTTVTMSGPIEARVLTGLQTNPLGSYCAVALEGLTLSTTSNNDFPGVPFDGGITGTGALTGTYNITQDAVSVGGADCATVNQVSKGAGSIWLSNGIAEPPVCPEGTTGIPPNCVPNECPAGQIGTPPNCVDAVARISRVAVSGPSKAKRGKSAAYKVRITNNGNIAATGVRLRVSGKGVAVNSSVGRVNAGATRTVTVRVRFRSTGRIRGTFRVTSNNAGGKTVKRTVRVSR